MSSPVENVSMAGNAAPEPNGIKTEVGTKEISKDSAESNRLLTCSDKAEVKPVQNSVLGIKLPGICKKTKLKKNSNEKILNDDNDVMVSNEGKFIHMKTRIRNFVARKSSTNENSSSANIKEINNTDLLQCGDQDVSHIIKINDVFESEVKESDKVQFSARKAGLASIETLNESTKNQDYIKNLPHDTKDPLELNEQKTLTQSAFLLKRLRSYTCSIDDVLIVLGIILFLLIVSAIGLLLTRESLTSSPLRDGRYIDAVTSCGMVEGIKEDGSFAFRKIPYALPPVGNRRWKPAQPIDNIDDCWQDKLQAYNVSDVLCSQLQSNDLNSTSFVGTEDCLYLDIITPHVRYDNLLPVIVLIGADSFTGPSPGILRPSARYARSHDVVFVRPNFRLGPFGFLALQTLSKQAYPPVSGNYGLSDIIMALKWVQLNIKNFGGNPDMVTLLGHRAGGTLVIALTTSTATKSLFARAWISSPSSMFPGKQLSDSEQRNQQFMDEINCADIECLLNATTDQVWAATPDYWLHSASGLPTIDEGLSAQQHEWLVLDGEILKQHPADYWKEQSNVVIRDNPRFVIGTTLHEMHSNKLRYIHANWTDVDVRNYLRASRLGALNLTEAAVERYNCTNYNQLIAMITDIRSTCPLLINTRIQTGVLFYLITQGQSEDQLALLGADVLAILGRYEAHTVEERRLVSSIQQLFYYYVAHGRIKMYDEGVRLIKLGQDPLAVDDHDNCNFWIRNDIVPRYARH